MVPFQNVLGEALGECGGNFGGNKGETGEEYFTNIKKIKTHYISLRTLQKAAKNTFNVNNSFLTTLILH